MPNLKNEIRMNLLMIDAATRKVASYKKRSKKKMIDDITWLSNTIDDFLRQDRIDSIRPYQVDEIGYENYKRLEEMKTFQGNIELILDNIGSYKQERLKETIKNFMN